MMHSVPSSHDLVDQMAAAPPPDLQALSAFTASLQETAAAQAIANQQKAAATKAIPSLGERFWLFVPYVMHAFAQLAGMVFDRDGNDMCASQRPPPPPHVHRVNTVVDPPAC